jgi:hypothetical protein
MPVFVHVIDHPRGARAGRHWHDGAAPSRGDPARSSSASTNDYG